MYCSPVQTLSKLWSSSRGCLQQEMPWSSWILLAKCQSQHSCHAGVSIVVLSIATNQSVRQYRTQLMHLLWARQWKEVASRRRQWGRKWHERWATGPTQKHSIRQTFVRSLRTCDADIQMWKTTYTLEFLDHFSMVQKTLTQTLQLALISSRQWLRWTLSHRLVIWLLKS